MFSESELVKLLDRYQSQTGSQLNPTILARYLIRAELHQQLSSLGDTLLQAVNVLEDRLADTNEDIWLNAAELADGRYVSGGFTNASAFASSEDTNQLAHVLIELAQNAVQ